VVTSTDQGPAVAPDDGRDVMTQSELQRAIIARTSLDLTIIWAEWKKGAKDGWAVLLGVAIWLGLLSLAGHEPSDQSVWYQLRALTLWADHLSHKFGVSRSVAGVILVTLLGSLSAWRGSHTKAISFFQIWGRGSRRLFELPSTALFLATSALILQSPLSHWKLWLALAPAQFAFGLYPRVAVSVWSALFLLAVLSVAATALW
jgi:hypothetical protein